jgi:hypothetical protein
LVTGKWEIEKRNSKIGRQWRVRIVSASPSGPVRAQVAVLETGKAKSENGKAVRRVCPDLEVGAGKWKSENAKW